MKNLISLGLLVAFVGVCQCQYGYDPLAYLRGGPKPPQPQQFRSSVDSRFDDERDERDRFDPSRRRYGSDRDGYGGFDRYGDRYDRRTNCQKSGPEGFDTGYCKEIPDDRDLEQSHDEEAMTADITEFALQLFKAANKPEAENIVLSGLSPQVLLSYLNWASDGVTREEMKKAKVFGSPKNVQKMISRILSSNDDTREMNIATAFFSSPDVVLNKDFKVKVSEKVDIVNVDFKKSDRASNTIRNWATQKTKGKLDLSGVSFPIDTKLALVSTMLYSGKWYFKFENVTDEDFTLANGRKIKVPMMKIKKKYNHGLLGEYAEWGSIPYRSKEAMVIIMPTNGDTIDETIKKLTNEEILDICESARSDYTSADLTLSMPKFKLATTTNLVEPLKKMGIQKLFTPAAELAYLAKDRNIQVSDVEQKSGIEVDQDGTIVVTYTNVNAVALSIQRDPPKVTFNVNRPFVAMICDVQRSIPLVMAKISDPSKSE